MSIRQAAKKHSKFRRTHGLTFESLQSRQLMAADLFAAAEPSTNLLLPAVQQVSSYSVSGITSNGGGAEAILVTCGDVVLLRGGSALGAQRGITLDVEANDTLQNAIGGGRPEASRGDTILGDIVCLRSDSSDSLREASVDQVFAELANA